jgi:CBS domain-containing protein
MEPFGRPLSELVVADVMTLDPIVIAADAPLEDAERLMRERAISGLPVVDPNGGLVGVLSRTDVVEDGSIPMAILLRDDGPADRGRPADAR